MQAVTNDTNVTGTISAQNLTLGWTAQLGVSRGGTGTSTTPSAGQILVGNASSGYDLKATSTLGFMPLSTGTTDYVARWSSASQLSIGTLLDNGTVAGVNATSSTANFLVQGTGSNNPFQVTSSSTNSLVIITPTGNVGIGTSVPQSILNVASSQPAVRLTLTNTANQSSIDFYDNGILENTVQSLGSTSGGVRQAALELYSANGDIRFLTNGDFTNPKMMIKNGGKVGIATTSDVNLALIVNGGFGSSNTATTTINTITYNLDLSLSNGQPFVLATTTAISFINPSNQGVRLVFRQDSTGSRVPTFSNCSWDKNGTPTFSTTAGKDDIVSVWYVKAFNKYYCSSQQGF